MAEDDVCSFSGVQTIELACHHLYILAKAGRRRRARKGSTAFLLLKKQVCDLISLPVIC